MAKPTARDLSTKSGTSPQEADETPAEAPTVETGVKAKVRMESSMAGDDPNRPGQHYVYQIGDVVELDEAWAERWVAKGAASWVDDDTPHKHTYPPSGRPRTGRPVKKPA